MSWNGSSKGSATAVPPVITRDDRKDPRKRFSLIAIFLLCVSAAIIFVIYCKSKPTNSQTVSDITASEKKRQQKVPGKDFSRPEVNKKDSQTRHTANAKDLPANFAPDGKTRVVKLSAGKWRIYQADGTSFITEKESRVNAALSVGTPDLLPPYKSSNSDDERIPKTPPRYSNVYAQRMAQFAVPGTRTQPLDFVITDDAARKACEEEISFNYDDPDDVLAEKLAVKEMQKDLLAHLDNGGTAKDYFKQLEQRQEIERETYQHIHKDVSELIENGKIEDAQCAIDKYNEYLKDKGYPPVSMTGQFIAYKIRNGLMKPPSNKEK